MQKSKLQCKIQNYKIQARYFTFLIVIFHFAFFILHFHEASADIPASPTMGDIIRATWNGAIRPAIIFLFVLATVVFIWGLIEFVASADSEEGRTRGKRNIIWGIVGMAIMFATGAIMTILDNFFKSL